MSKRWVWLTFSLICCSVIAPALALNNSVGKKGINALRLHQSPYNLLGRKIGIGQVEIGRPGKFGIDKAGAKNTGSNPHEVFYRNNLPISNKNIDNHATMVARVMIGDRKYLRGVSPKARLYASAVGSLQKGGQEQECLATQHIALQNGGDVRAINFSFGESLARDPREDAKLDGKALLTECIDWSARVHNTLYVIAGNQGKGGIPIPTDNFNGITTAYTTKRQDVFTKVDFANLSAFPVGIGRSVIKKEINVGTRRAIGLLAPGSNLSIYNQRGEIERVSGTSFAAPHITGSVALLQEYGDRVMKSNKIQNKSIHNLSVPLCSLDCRRHEVMKAVLLNSADKIKDRGDGAFLGMEKTILSEKNFNWLESDAYRNPRIPLDMEMGTGHLNTFRAYRQFSAGQISPKVFAPKIGWDYRTLAVNEYKDYVLEQSLSKGNYIAITLTWDRLVELTDRNNNDRYDLGETFRDRGLNNLDVYLMPTNENNNLRNTCSSISREDSVEHIFCPIPSSGRYKIRVYYRRQINEPTQSYALAWWTGRSAEEQGRMGAEELQEQRR